MIATPSPGVVKSCYALTLAATVGDLVANGHNVKYEIAGGGETVTQRNGLATNFLASPDLTHLFFIDSDMQFDGRLCRRLLSHDKPMIGCFYRRRTAAPSWVSSLGNGSTVTNGIAPCDTIPFGAALIRRDALEAMAKRWPSKGGLGFYHFFSVRPEDVGDPPSEDISFCRRWRIDCGGEIWALLDAKIGHIGDYAYGADQSYLDYLNAHVHTTDVAPAS